MDLPNELTFLTLKINYVKVVILFGNIKYYFYLCNVKLKERIT